MSLQARSQKTLEMVGLGMANLMSVHQMQNGQLTSGRNGATASMLKHGAYFKGNGMRPSGSGQQAPSMLQGAPHSQINGSKRAQGDWPSCSFAFDQAQEEQLTTIHRLLHSAINNVDPIAAGIVLDGTFYPFSAKCTPFQPGRGFLLPPEVEVRWDDSLPFPQKPVEQRVLVYYPAEKRVRWEAQTIGRKQVEGTALLVESKTYTLQLEKELCIKYEMRLSQDVLNFMQAKSSPTLISHAVRPFRMRANALQAPEIALSVSSAGALHPDSTWQTRSGSSAEAPLSRLSGTPPMEPSNARAISNLFLFHRKLHFPERVPPEPALQNGRFAKQVARDAKPTPPVNGVTVPPSLETKPGVSPAMLARDARGRAAALQMSQTLSRLQNGSSALPQAQVLLQPGVNDLRSEGLGDANGGRPQSGGMGRPPSSHSRQTGSESGQGGRVPNGLAGFQYSSSQELNSWAPALAKAAENARMGVPEKARNGPAQPGGVNRGLPLGYTMDKISRLSAQQQSLLLQQAQLLQHQRQMQQQQPKPLPGLSPGFSNMIPTPGYMPQQPPAPPVSQPEPVPKLGKGRNKGKKGKQDAHSGQLSPANSAANSSANSHPLSSSAPARNPSPATLPAAGYDQNVPIAQLLKANRKKHKSEAASGGSSPTASRDSLKQSQRPLQRAASSVSAGSFLSALSNPVPKHGTPPVPEVSSPRGREGGTMIPTPGLSLLGQIRPALPLPLLPTDASSTGSLLEAPGFSAFTGRGQNGTSAAAARSSDSLQGLGNVNMSSHRGPNLGGDPSFGGMQMIPTPGMMPTPGMNVAGRAWEPSADLLSDLQSSGANGVETGSSRLLEQWPQQQGSFMDMLTDNGGGSEEGGEAPDEGAADASADPFKEVLDSLDLDLFQEEGELAQGEAEGAAPELMQAVHGMPEVGASFTDGRGAMELEMLQAPQQAPSVSGSQWAGGLLGSGNYPGAQAVFEGGYPSSSSGLDHPTKEQFMGGDAGLLSPYMQLRLDQNVQPAHANTSYVSWDPGTAQQLPTQETGSTFVDGSASAVPSHAQVDDMGLDGHGDPGLNGALDELMELDADFLDINMDDGMLFEGGIGEGDWSSLGGF